MASPIGSRGTFHLPRDSRGASIALHISEQSGIQAENLSLSTWGASYVLANVLHRLDLPGIASHGEAAVENGGEQRPCVLELGAGTGLVGITAAALWQSKTLLTDLASIVPAIAANISLNKDHFAARSVRCGSLDWSQPEEMRLFPAVPGDDGEVIRAEDVKADVILAADTIYSEEHPALLTQTIKHWLRRSPRSRVVLCYPLRMAYIDHVREFWSLMEASGFESLQEGREDGEEGWNEIAHTPYEWCIWSWATMEDDRA